MKRAAIYVLCFAALGFKATSVYSQSPATKPVELASAESSSKEAARLAYKATYKRDVLPIVMGKCYRCHNPDSKVLPNWTDYKTAFNDRYEIRRRIWDSYKGHYYKQSMPAGNGPECQAITEQERLLVKEWVDSGATLGVAPDSSEPKSKQQKIEAGKALFTVVCTPCHQATGLGIPSQFPPLAKSDFLNADKTRAVRILLHGLQGEVTVNGRTFNNSMPSFPLSDGDIASALTYVYNSFGNSGQEVTVDEVKTLRNEQYTAPTIKAVAASAPSPYE